MYDEISKAHDKFFKRMIGNENNIVDFLRFSLPDEVLSEINLTNLSFINTSYIDDKYKEYYSDIVVSTTLQSNKGIDIYILIEHKSQCDSGILLQLLRYHYLIWNKDYEDKKPLRAIIPIVFYHGEKEWSITARFIDLFDIPESLRCVMLDFGYFLVDTNKYSDDEIINSIARNNRIFLTAMLLFKGVHNKDLTQINSAINLWDIDMIQQKKELFLFIFEYILYDDKITLEELKSKVEEKIPDGGDIVQSTAQRLKEEGKLEGIKVGEEKGKKETAIKMLAKGLDIDFIHEVTGLSIEEIMEIKNN